VAFPTLATAETPARAQPGRRRNRRLEVSLAAAAVMFIGWLLSGIGTAWTRMAVDDLAYVAASSVAATACWRAHTRRRNHHTGWAWLGTGCLIWLGAAVVWAVYELVLGQVAPFPSYADIGFVGYAVPVIVGVTRFRRSSGRFWSRWRVALDWAVIGGCLLLTSMLWVLGPVFHGTSGAFVRIDAIAYPLADVAVASIMITRCMVFAQARRPVWVPLSAGLLVLALTDSLYVAATYAGNYHPGGLLDGGWVVSFLLVALAALAAPLDDPTSAAQEIETPTYLQRLLPYVTMAIAGVSLWAHRSEVHGNGRELWLAVPLLLAIAARQLFVVADYTTLARDLTAAVARRTTELAQREQWWRELVQNLSDVVVVIDAAGRVIYCSPQLETALGIPTDELQDAGELASYVHPDDLEAALAEVEPVLEGRNRQGFSECRLRRADGRWSWFEVTALGHLESAALDGTVITLHDVSERRRLTDRLAHQAYHDALTGLPNRAFLMQRIEQALAHRVAVPFALMLIDLDDFKVINDRHGHASGDLVLEVVGRRLEATVRVEDTVARLGGDEFAVLVSGSVEDIRATANRIADRIAQPVVTSGRRFLVRASVGVVFADEGESETAHSLLSHADIALYEAKAREKGSVVLMNAAERDVAAKQVYLREQIAQPVLHEFHVVYQPIVDLANGQLRGVESLLRWRHPDLGYVPPDIFIPMAEYGGSIQILGWHVLQTALAQLADWSRIVPDHRLATGVNVSVRQLDEPGFASRLLALIDDFGVVPDQLVLEITEQALAVDFETAVAVVAELRDGGVSVAVDDYGTGYSSLRYLHRFAADVVKVDRSFIANLSGSVHTQKIVRSVIEMADSLDVQSIAEGIETVTQLELVRALGCELGQGYLFSKPVEADEITEILRERTSLFPPGSPAPPMPAFPVVPRPRSEREMHAQQRAAQPASRSS
jgi:diguanylate cyclase (GGDEF)-like protein/PAS domain S-box-containing protein